MKRLKLSDKMIEIKLTKIKPGEVCPKCNDGLLEQDRPDRDGNRRVRCETCSFEGYEE